MITSSAFLTFTWSFYSEISLQFHYVLSWCSNERQANDVRTFRRKSSGMREKRFDEYFDIERLCILF